ncbi:unnamed protein product, partial [Callosobruchus maculatus]
MIPKADERRKYSKRTLSSESLIQQSALKRRMMEQESVDSEDVPIESQLTPKEINEQFIMENLTLEKAVYLIVTNIPKLPPTLPPEFVRDYADFVTNGNIGKVHVANVMAAQFIEAGVGPGAK